MVKEALEPKCSDRKVLNVLHKEGVYFKSLREKLPLSKEDEQARYDFAMEYKNWTPKRWCASLARRARLLKRVAVVLRAWALPRWPGKCGRARR